MKEKAPVLFTGIKPTGPLHLGNYFGAIRPLLRLLQGGSYKCFVMIADYHALNFVQDASRMREYTVELMRAYLAAGIPMDSVSFFRQSDVPAHTELAWIFDTITSMPYLMRSHAFKDAEAKNREITVGTFNYPMLMAADVLLYDAVAVPVGPDQKQHIEYARDTAEKFNRIFKKEIFILPEPIISETVAVIPGTDGRKMSKSYGNTIPLFTTRDELQEKVMSIVTDSSGERPEQVYDLHRLIRSESELSESYQANRGNYKALKEQLAEDLSRFLAPLWNAYEHVSDADIRIALADGAHEARAQSEAKMTLVREAIGVRP